MTLLLRFMLVAIVLINAFGTNLGAWAIDTSPPIDTNSDERAATWEKLYRAKQAELDRVKADIEAQDIKLYESWVAFKVADHNYRREIKEINIQTLQDQRVASKAIMWLVIFITVAGLFFAYVQLSAGISRPFSQMISMPPAPITKETTTPSTEENRKEIDKENKDLMEKSTMSISLTGLSITTSAIGVLILIISLAFTYLYLEKVYTISIIDPETLTVQQSSRKAISSATQAGTTEPPIPAGAK